MPMKSARIMKRQPQRGTMRIETRSQRQLYDGYQEGYLLHLHDHAHTAIAKKPEGTRSGKETAQEGEEDEAACLHVDVVVCGVGGARGVQLGVRSGAGRRAILAGSDRVGAKTGNTAFSTRNAGRTFVTTYGATERVLEGPVPVLVEKVEPVACLMENWVD